MAWTESAGSQTSVISTEHSLATPTSVGEYLIEVDVSAMVNGDLLELRAYDKIDGTNYQQIWKGVYQHVQINTAKASPAIALTGAGMKFTLKQTAGTGRVFPWSVRTLSTVNANLTQILGTVLTETSGQIAAAFKKVFDVASATFTALSVNQTGDGYARMGAPAGASVSADIAAIRLDTNTTVPNLIAALNNVSLAGVKTQGVAVMRTDAYAEPAQGAPASTQSMGYKIDLIYKFMINLKTQTANQLSVFNAAGTVIDHKITSIGDDGTTLTEPAVITGP